MKTSFPKGHPFLTIPQKRSRFHAGMARFGGIAPKGNDGNSNHPFSGANC